MKPYCCAVGLPLDQEHPLGQAVGGVRLLRVAVPEVVLPERHRRELRVGADRPDRDELLHAGEARLLHELDAHDRVLVEEPARVLPVRPDPADHGGEVDDQLRPPVGEGAVDAVLRPEVVVPRARHEDLSRRRRPGAGARPPARGSRRRRSPSPGGRARTSSSSRYHQVVRGEVLVVARERGGPRGAGTGVCSGGRKPKYPAPRYRGTIRTSDQSLKRSGERGVGAPIVRGGEVRTSGSRRRSCFMVDLRESMRDHAVDQRERRSSAAQLRHEQPAGPQVGMDVGDRDCRVARHAPARPTTPRDRHSPRAPAGARSHRQR